MNAALRPLPAGLALACALALLLPGPALGADGASAPFTVTWLGHAGFEIESAGGTRLLIDPWLTDNPYTPPALKDVQRYAAPGHRPAAILLTHPHEDHTADALRLAQATGAPVVGTLETLRSLGIPEAQAHSVNVGGTLRFGDVTVHAVPAMHSADPGGRPLGYVLTFADGRSLYHTGDTWIFGDMALIERLYHPEVVLLAVGGGRWGMDARTARLAVQSYFRPRIIVPMHYGAAAFPLASEEEVRAAFRGEGRLRVLEPGKPERMTPGRTPRKPGAG